MKKLLALLFLCAATASAQSTVKVQLTDNTHKWYEQLPVKHKTADRAFWLWQSVSQAATVADVENSIYVLQHCGGCIERNPIFGQHPNRAVYYGITEGIFVAEVPFTFYYKRQDDALKAAGIQGHRYAKWWILPALNTAGHGVGVGVTVGLTGR